MYSRPVSRAEVDQGAELEGVYIYPDFAACVQGTWAKHILVQGKAVIVIVDRCCMY